MFLKNYIFTAVVGFLLLSSVYADDERNLEPAKTVVDQYLDFLVKKNYSECIKLSVESVRKFGDDELVLLGKGSLMAKEYPVLAVKNSVFYSNRAAQFDIVDDKGLIIGVVVSLKNKDTKTWEIQYCSFGFLRRFYIDAMMP